MKSDFNCFYKSFMVSEESERLKIKKEIDRIKDVYGTAAGTEIEQLVNIVTKYGKELKKLKDANIIKKPSEPKEPTRDSYKNQSGYDKAVLNYPKKIQQYKTNMDTYWSQLIEFNDKKLKELSTISNKASDYNIPEDGECQLEYVTGNSKVGDDTIIINMGPATTCDAAKAGECELYSMGFCYAQNNETQHKLAIVKRFREQLQWKADNDGSTIASQLASVIMQKRKGKKYTKYVRFNEAGDMNTEQDKEKLGNIVEQTNEILAENEQEPVIFYTYTHRNDLFPDRKNDIDDSNALVIQGSGFYKDAGKSTKKAFYVDNCFMGIDYPNLVDLVRNGNFEQLTELEDDDNEGRLGIDFEDEKPTIMICKGACFGCQWCKTKGKRYLILVAYHGSGTKIKSDSGQMTTKLGKLEKELGALLDKNNLPPEIKRELYDIGHFNEYLIVDRLIGYAMHRNAKGPKQPIISWGAIAPLILNIRKLAEEDQKDSIKQWKASGGKGFSPRVSSVGSKFPT